jgi:hypothetical protein
MESFDYLSELSTTVSEGARDKRLREAHAAMVELDGERGEPVCVWHAGCNTGLINLRALSTEAEAEAEGAHRRA